MEFTGTSHKCVRTEDVGNKYFEMSTGYPFDFRIRIGL